ncbi:DnaJ (Hsp40) homolog, subfamily C, member 11, isoform CRA_a [Mus musculus]|nr:DnaJ (Hsp40) homolog, subfamily C, member 11, isoform CRA_a [Mus musculus]
MATALSEEELDNEDYYSLLNVRREASSEELKAAYRRLCMLYHPDKHRDPELKSQAERLFNLVHQAYEVLSDPQTRAIYDIYGKRGLEMEGWEVVERKRTPAEIREEFERLQREREERRLQQRTNPKLCDDKLCSAVFIPWDPAWPDHCASSEPGQEHCGLPAVALGYPVSHEHQHRPGH